MTTWIVRPGPCDGGVFLASPTAIEQVRVVTPATARRNEPFDITIRITNVSGEKIPAVIPVRVTISDPNGRLAEHSGFHAARDGELILTFEPAANDAPGVWEIRACELVTGQVATEFTRIVP